MYNGPYLMLPRVYRGNLHSGFVRQRAPTETPECCSDPTNPCLTQVTTDKYQQMPAVLVRNRYLVILARAASKSRVKRDQLFHRTIA